MGAKSAKPNHPLVLISWNDAYSPASTEEFNAADLSLLQKAIPIVTSGWLIYEDDARLIVGGEWSGDEDFRNVTVVPRGMMTKIEFIRKPHKRVPKAVAEASSFDHGVTNVS